MKYDKDTTSDSQIIEFLDSLPEELRERIAFREYCRQTRQVFAWTIGVLNAEECNLITQGLKDEVYSKIEFSQLPCGQFPPNPRRVK